MTYQGERARAVTAGDAGGRQRCFEVSKIRVGADGRVCDVLWAEVNAASDQAAYAAIVSPAAEVIDAIHDGAQVAAVFPASAVKLPERRFVIFDHEDGSECIGLDAPPSPGRDLSDMVRLDNYQGREGRLPCSGGSGGPGDVHGRDRTHRGQRPAAQQRNQPGRLLAGGGMRTFAVSKVGLDVDGRVTRVLWGRVDTVRNAWATPEVVAPVAEAVEALSAGDQVFALFPSIHGHLPERRFVIADYDGGLKTIVLDGPPTHEREVHDMDRINPQRTGP